MLTWPLPARARLASFMRCRHTCPSDILLTARAVACLVTILHGPCIGSHKPAGQCTLLTTELGLSTSLRQLLKPQPDANAILRTSIAR